MSAPPLHEPRPGDVLVPLPHTLTRATLGRFDAEARAALPAATSLSRTAPDPRLVLDAAACAVVDAAGAETVAAVARGAAAAGVGVVVVDATPRLVALLETAARGRMSITFAERPPAEPPRPGDVTVLPLDDAARERLAARRRRR